jgi:hypothetical protein
MSHLYPGRQGMETGVAQSSAEAVVGQTEGSALAAYAGNHGGSGGSDNVVTLNRR